jgi:uncharacterized protein (DUF927 family)
MNNEKEEYKDIDVPEGAKEQTLESKLEAIATQMAENPISDNITIDDFKFTFCEEICEHTGAPESLVTIEHEGERVSHGVLYQVFFNYKDEPDKHEKAIKKNIINPFFLKGLQDENKQPTPYKINKSTLKAFEEFRDRHNEAMREKIALYEMFRDIKKRIDLQIRENRRNSKCREFEGVELPFPYCIVGSSLCRTETKRNGDDEYDIDIPIAAACVLTGISDTDENTFIRLAWKTNSGKVRSEIHPLSRITGRQGLLGLCESTGFLIPETKIGDLIDYFHELLQGDIPQILVTDRNGWHGSGTFVWGDKTIGGDGQDYIIMHPERSQYLKKAGTPEGYAEGIRGLITDPVFSFVYAHSYASILLKPLNLDSNVGALTGPTSRGKTTGQKLSESGMGDPSQNRLSLTGDITINATEPYLHELTDLPTFLDELSFKNKKRDDFISYLKYKISSNEGKKRMVKSGYPSGVTWKTCLQVNMEEAITDTHSKDGETARVVDVQQLPKHNPEGVHKFESIIMPVEGIYEGHYGHVIEPFVLKAIELAKTGQLKPKYDKYRELFRHDDSKKDRLSKLFAAIALSGEILRDIFKSWGLPEIDYVTIVKDITDEYLESTPEPVHIRALNTVINRTLENWEYLNEPEAQGATEHSDGITHSRDVIGYYHDGEDELKLIPSMVEDWLDNKGKTFDYNQTMKQWKEQGIIATQKSRSQPTVRRKCDGKDIYVIAINVKKLEEHTGVNLKAGYSAYIKTNSSPRQEQIDLSKFKRCTVKRVGNIEIPVSKINSGPEDKFEAQN